MQPHIQNKIFTIFKRHTKSSFFHVTSKSSASTAFQKTKRSETLRQKFPFQSRPETSPSQGKFDKLNKLKNKHSNTPFANLHID